MANLAVAPRSPHTQQLPYFRRSVAFNTNEIGTTGRVPLGTLPAGAIVTGGIIKVTAAFNAATTNVLTIGTAADDDEVLAAADLDETEADTTLPLSVLGYKVSVPTTLYVKYTQTGTAATTGAADVILFFVPNNDR